MKQIKWMLCVLLAMALAGCGATDDVTLRVEIAVDFPVYGLDMEWYADGEPVGGQGMRVEEGDALNGEPHNFTLEKDVDFAQGTDIEIACTLTGDGFTRTLPDRLPLSAETGKTYRLRVSGATPETAVMEFVE